MYWCGFITWTERRVALNVKKLWWVITTLFCLPERKAEVRFTALKQEGNDFVKKGQYQDALGKYTECLKLKPEECAIYTNRLEPRSHLNKNKHRHCCGLFHFLFLTVLWYSILLMVCFLRKQECQKTSIKSIYSFGSIKTDWLIIPSCHLSGGAFSSVANPSQPSVIHWL